MDITSLESPCLLLDKAKLENNLTRMTAYLADRGVPLRLHVKTAKNINIVQMGLQGQPGGITVSTLKEAEYFLEHGISDITYAVGIAPGKLDHAAALVSKGADLTLLLDNMGQARALNAYNRVKGLKLKALIEIDVDGHRAGVKPDDPVLIDIGRSLGGALAGVLTHAGGSYDCRSVDAIRAIAAQERDLTIKAAERLRRDGLPCPVVSIGSTPTAAFGENFDGVTEVRAGVFVFQDLVQVGLGVCSLDDIAISVLGSVIGYQHEKNWLLADTGWTALSRDRGTAAQALDQGYGLVCDQEGKPYGDLIVRDVNQEHGIIADRHGRPIDFGQFPIGAMVRILPNHACATAAAHNRYHVVEDGRITEVWQRFNGW